MKPAIAAPGGQDRRRFSGCAVCAAPIHQGYLMCARHWRLVPRHLQVDVTRTWNRFERRKSRQEGLELLHAYRTARDAAIQAVNGSDEPNPPLPASPTNPQATTKETA